MSQKIRGDEGKELSTPALLSPRPAPEEFRDFVVEESRKGNVVLMDFEGFQIAPLDEFIKQPAEGILYDLNRLPEVVMTFIDDPKWVNDYAVSMVIRRLRDGNVSEWVDVMQRNPPIRRFVSGQGWQPAALPYVLAVDVKGRMSVGYAS